ncbi:hypothetical protein BLX87_23060 [Bacillus sp. VT-16-64]|uniref:hypothetical protein n=1 Tax=Siminovitchia sp. FSL W7-1587 TaxID=2954699 RepID=UPI00097D68D9|nr:hypothetical protein BLX87_23060 [Bacillus sp. VT-16-64]
MQQINQGLREITCGNCGKPITTKTDVEYSRFYSQFYCNYNCALNDFFDRAQCTPFDFTDKQQLSFKGIEIKKGKFHWK